MTELMTTGLDLHSDPSADPIMDIIAGGTRYKVSDFFPVSVPLRKNIYSPPWDSEIVYLFFHVLKTYEEKWQTL